MSGSQTDAMPAYLPQRTENAPGAGRTDMMTSFDLPQSVPPPHSGGGGIHTAGGPTQHVASSTPSTTTAATTPAGPTNPSSPLHGIGQVASDSESCSAFSADPNRRESVNRSGTYGHSAHYSQLPSTQVDSAAFGGSTAAHGNSGANLKGKKAGGAVTGGVAFGSQPANPANVANPKYPLDWTLVADAFERREPSMLRAHAGDLNHLASILQTDLTQGISVSTLEERRAAFGANVLPRPPPVTFLEMVIDALGDRIMQILIVAAVISIIFGLTLPNPHSGVVERDHGWIEGTAILISVIVVVLVGSINNYNKAKKFEEMEAGQAVREVEVIRDGNKTTIMADDLVVGDVMIMTAGMELPVDGVVSFSQQLGMNESPITGEPDQIKKTVEGDCIAISGTSVEEGNGRMVIVAVGVKCQKGIQHQVLHGKKASHGNKDAAAAGANGDADAGKAGKEAAGAEVGHVDGHHGISGSADGHSRKSGGSKKDDDDDEEDNAETPLQQHLTALGDKVGIVGLVGAVLLVVALCIKEGILIGTQGKKAAASSFLNFVIIAITLIAVAIPEGLPLAVTIALAYSMKAMSDENCLVRNIASCETMGAATAVCSDKTGTLTLNQMTVVQAVVAGVEFIFDGCGLQPRTSSVVTLPNSAMRRPDLAQLDGVEAVQKKAATGHAATVLSLLNIDQTTLKEFHCAIALNSTAGEQENEKTKQIEWRGPKTEIGILNLLGAFEESYTTYRAAHKEEDVKMWPFDSGRKKMTVVLRRPQRSMTVFVKGASEVVLATCTSYVDRTGTVHPMTPEARAHYEAILQDMAEQGNRTIAVARVDSPPFERTMEFPEDEPELPATLVAILGIQDPLRAEVPAAVKACNDAGLVVRMITGDNIHTAVSIAKKCGIFNANGYDLAITGPDFRSLYTSDVEALKRIVPRIRVMARSSPHDKHILVGLLQEAGHVVGVTGDGTNDAPALKLSDVGFAMATGTDIARGASDMVLLDDNFATVITAIRWGRAVNNNIKKFLQYQLSINGAGVLITIVSSLASESSKEALTAVQLLWLNLIMDTLAALSIATETPEDSVLQRRPLYKQAPLITRRVTRFMVMHGCYQFIMVMLVMFLGWDWFNIVEGPDFCDRPYDPILVNTTHNTPYNTTDPMDPSSTITVDNFTYTMDLVSDPRTLICREACEKDGGKTRDGYRCMQGPIHSTLVFNMFIFFQVFNVFNGRKTQGEFWVFEGLWARSKYMLIITLIICGFQVFAVEVAGSFMDTTRLKWDMWLISVGLGATELIWGIVVNAVPVEDIIPDEILEREAHEASVRSAIAARADPHGDEIAAGNAMVGGHEKAYHARAGGGGEGHDDGGAALARRMSNVNNGSSAPHSGRRPSQVAIAMPGFGEGATRSPGGSFRGVARSLSVIRKHDPSLKRTSTIRSAKGNHGGHNGSNALAGSAENVVAAEMQDLSTK